MNSSNYIIKWINKETRETFFDTVDAGLWPTKEWDIADANDPDLRLIHYTYNEAVKAVSVLEKSNPKYELQIKRCKR